MGFISALAAGKVSIQNKSAFGDVRRGERLWNQTFGRTTQADENKFPRVRPVPGGTYGRSVAGSDAATKRLVQAMRSMAPGGWSDDRYQQTVSFTGIAYTAISRICAQLSQSEFQVFKKDPRHQDGKRPVTEMDPPEGDRQVKPYQLVKLLERPNNRDSFGKLMDRWGQQKRLTGTALTWMLPNRLGTPMELYCIPTAIAIPQPAINPDYPDGYYRIQPVYPYGPFSSYPTPTTAVGAPIPAQWMLRFQYPHPYLFYDGYSPLTGLRLEMDEFNMIGRSRHYKMKNSINPSAVLNFAEVDGMEGPPEPEIERIRAEWENEFQSPENHGRLIVTTNGATLDQFGTNPIDMDYPDGWNQLMSFILGGGFGITKQAAGMIEDSSYATLFATLKQLHLVTLKPECDDIGAELTHHLAPFFGDDLIVEVKCPRIDDHEVNFQKIDKGVAANCITKNQVLKLLDLPTTKEKWGEEMAGPPKQEGQEGMQDPGAPDKSQLFGNSKEGPGKLMQGKPEEEKAEPKEVTQSRPKTGPMGEGSLGPRKSLVKALQNGHHKNGKARIGR